MQPSQQIHKSNPNPVVLFLIDGLRWDMLSSDALFPYLHEFSKGPHRSGCHAYRFYADPPTTTSQRLRGLMTGTLPVYIEIGNNFEGQKVEEDNLLAQLHGRQKRYFCYQSCHVSHIKT